MRDEPSLKEPSRYEVLERGLFAGEGSYEEALGFKSSLDSVAVALFAGWELEAMSRFVAAGVRGDSLGICSSVISGDSG